MITHYITEGISMSDRIGNLSKRPGTIKNIHTITLSCEKRTPYTSRKAPEFKDYFDIIWKELDINAI